MIRFCSIKTVLLYAAVVATIHQVAAQKPMSSSGYDPIDYAAVQRQLDRASRPTLSQRLGDMLTRPLSSDEHFSLSGRVGLAYTRETDIAITAAATGLYPSSSGAKNSIELAAMVSVNGFFNLRATGENYLGADGRHQLSYTASGGSLPTRFWGLGYEAATHNTRTKYTLHNVASSLRYYYAINSALKVGAGVDFGFNKAAEFTPLAEQYLASANQSIHSLYTTGIGIGASYDRRNNPHTTSEGYHIALYGELRPKALGDYDHSIWHFTLQADYFQPLWQGGVLAIDLYGDLWSHSTPWLLWPSAGGQSRMRGYYLGRYTERKMITAQLELRQTIYGPIGICLWGGVGSLFDRWRNFDTSEILPNGGIGLRLADNGHTTLRIDYGFGRQTSCLIINVNEAF